MIAAMVRNEVLERFTGRVRARGLLDPGSDGVVMLSGGADSAALAAAAVRICGPQAIAAVHVNYGLRADSDAGEEAARALCAKLRIDLHIDRPELAGGNLQARAREARYATAERLRAKLRADWIATGHTRSDLAETFVYRLAVSPGARALTGMGERSGRLRRPLLAISRSETRALARAAALPFVDDPSNLDRRFARNRIRAELMPLLDEIGPEVERNIAETHAELSEQRELLTELAAEAIRAAGCEGGAPIRHEELATMQPALRRAVLTALAERASGGRPVRIGRSRAAEIMRLTAAPEGGEVELGRGLRAVAESGTVRFGRPGEDPPPEPVRLTIPGRAHYGEWEITAELTPGGAEPRGPELATLDAERLGDEVVIRAWREGDRIRPLGLGGSKSLQDVFSDRGVPRSLRPRLPVLVAGDRIAWVAGVAVSEEFRLGPRSRRSAVITARAVGES
jgi:tRNA(Ile)-lysidine synthase